MKISLPINQFMDDVGFPLVAGRVTIYKHDSDTPCKVFTLSGDIYTEAVNPIITSEDGRIPTLFFDAAVVDVKVEKANGDGSYELIDTFQSGFNMPDAKNDTVVEGIDALKDANPGVGIVSVYGYDDNVVGPVRHYVWDPTCTEAADDGIVVLSNTTETGRWILLWDDEKLPCTVYGISPGHEANISAFLGYPETVSQWNIRTPRIPRFLPGNYTSETTFTTTRSIYFDDGARFQYATFACKSAIVPSNSDFIADFVFTGQNVTAHSSWFRSVYRFWACGALDYYIDATNHFVNTSLTSPVTLNDKNIYGDTRLQMTYASGAYLEFTRCNIVAKNLFNPASDILVFNNMRWNDGWWTSSASLSQYDFGLVNQGHRLQFLLSYSMNRMELDNCANANIWLKRAAYELEQYGNRLTDLYELDLRGRTVTGLNGAWTTIRNARVTGTMRLAAASGTTLENVYATDVYCTGNAGIEAVNSTLIFGEKFHGSSLILRNCNTRGNVLDFIDVNTTTLTVQGGTFGDNRQVSRIRLPAYSGSWNQSNYNKSKTLTFRDCVLGAPVETCGPIYVDNCLVNQRIELYPWYENGSWLSQYYLRNNRFYDAFKLTLDERNPLYDAGHVNRVTMTGVVTNNEWSQADTEGFKVRLMDDQASIVYFLYPGSRLTYKGNTGSCPVELAGTSDYWDTPSAQFGGILVFPNSKYRNRIERVAGVIYSSEAVYSSSATVAHFPITWNDGGGDGDENEVRKINNPSDGTQKDKIRLMYMPYWFSDPKDENNDMFKVVLACGKDRNPPGWIRWLS